MKRLIWILLAGNVLLCAWLLLRAISAQVSSPELIADLAPSTLQLIATPAKDSAGGTPVSCLQIGPFSQENIARRWLLENQLPDVVTVRSEQLRPEQLSRVVMPGGETREAAQQALLALRDALQVADVRLENYLVTTGSLENFISLGLFGDVNNALRIQSQLAALGFEAEIIPESRDVERIWLLVLSSVMTPDLAQKIATAVQKQPELGMSEILC